MDGDRVMKRPFLVVYDYGQGGVWAFLLARTPSEIKKRFPELDVVERPPPWMTEPEIARIQERMTFDIDDEPRGFLETLIAGRGGSGEARASQG